jgi:UPF0755 protein
MSKKIKSKFFVGLIFVGLILAAMYFAYTKFFGGKINLENKNYAFLYIESDDDFEDVIDHLLAEKIINDKESFKWLAKSMSLESNIHAGKFRITNGMTARQIINLIKYNKQEQVKLTFNSQIHNLEEFIIYTAEKLELNQNELEEYFNDDKSLRNDFKLDPDNCFAAISPGVYETSWSVTLNEFIKILTNKYKNFWGDSQINKVKKLGYKIPEIITIASIVQSESSIAEEQQKIAGVYLNRLDRNMLLQADPTLKFANGNFSAQRVLDSDKEINSPYNTYKFKGLPPGPICLVYPQAINAVLNYTKHNYIFFCAKPSLNGYSDFSANYEQHQKYALAYQKAMDKKGIKR